MNRFAYYLVVILYSYQSSVLAADVWLNAVGGALKSLSEGLQREAEFNRQKELIRYQYELERQREEQFEQSRITAERQRRIEEDQRLALERQKAEQINRENEKNRISTGSGFYISTNGYFVTNYHVIQSAKSITLLNLDKHRVEAKVILTDADHDLALLKVEENTFALPIISSRSAKRGQFVATIGYPHADIQGIEPKVTDGIISSLSGISGNQNEFQISVPIQSGNSGGPLVTKDGNAIGIVVSKLSASAMLKKTGDVTQNVNYAIKSNYLIGLIDKSGLGLRLPNVYKKLSNNLEEITAVVEKSTALVIASPFESNSSLPKSTATENPQNHIVEKPSTVSPSDPQPPLKQNPTLVEIFDKTKNEALQGDKIAQQNLGFMYADGLIYAHISLCKDQPLYIIANSRNPLSMVMGPGGDSEAKPFQPPIRAMIQDAQASWFLWWGFFCFEVRPSY